MHALAGKGGTARGTGSMAKEEQLSQQIHLLQLPAGHGARVLAVQFLDEAALAAARLSDPDDEEALHDFRVALRRLRSVLSMYRAQFATPALKKLRKRLRRLARSTNTARDTEVQIAWIETQRPVFRGIYRRHLGWLLERLESRKGHGYRVARNRIGSRFPALESRLRQQCSVYRVEYAIDQPPVTTSFATETSQLLIEHLRDLEADCSRVRAIEDLGHAHQARIEIKRLRYLVTPIRNVLSRGQEGVRRLKALQDLLGSLQDTVVLGDVLAELAEEVASERTRRVIDVALDDDSGEEALRRERSDNPAPTLVRVAKLVKQRRAALFAELERDWLAGGALADLTEMVHADIRELAAMNAPRLG